MEYISFLKKRDSENLKPDNADAAPGQLKKSKSITSTTLSAVDRTTAFLAAWAAGRFNDATDDAAYGEYFTTDVVIDASAGAHAGVAELKTYHGLPGARDWMAVGAGYDFEGIEMSHVAGPTPNEVWLRVETTRSVYKATGKGAAHTGMVVLTWEGDKLAKLVNVPYQPARMAWVQSSDEDAAPLPPMAALPTFEPHPTPLEPYAKVMALWTAGEMSKPEVARLHVAADALCDTADSALDDALPGVLKAYEGFEEVLKWTAYIEANWDLSNVDVAPVAGLKAGCVTHRFTYDAKDKTTGKEAKGVQCYVELAYNAEGQFAYSRHYWVNSPLLASIQ